MFESKISSRHYPDLGVAMATVTNRVDHEGKMVSTHVNQDDHFAVQLPSVTAPDLQRVLTDFIALLQSLIAEEEGGSTLVLAAVLESEILFAHIGDSMGVHYGSSALEIKHCLTPHVPGLDPKYTRDVIIEFDESERDALDEILSTDFPELLCIDGGEGSASFLLSDYQDRGAEAYQRSLSDLRAFLEGRFPDVVMRTDTGYMPSRSLGDGDRLSHDLDFVRKTCSSEDVLVLATDGLSDVLSLVEIAASLKKLNGAIELVDIALKRSCDSGHADDITALVIQANHPFALVGVMDGHDIDGHVVSRFLAAAFEVVFPLFLTLKLKEGDSTFDEQRALVLNDLKAAVKDLEFRLKAWEKTIVQSWLECAHSPRAHGYSPKEVASACQRVWSYLWQLVDAIEQKKTPEKVFFETSTAFRESSGAAAAATASSSSPLKTA